MTKLVECVPNVSEGQDPRVIDQIADAVRGVSGVSLLDVDPGRQTNRTVFTFVGAPDAVADAAFALIRTTASLVDMRRHKGEHARIGATDVCPFVPVAGVSMEACAELARALAARVGRELGIPVYLYEEAASRPERRNLADIRRGEYEALREKLADPLWQPDAGPSAWSAEIARTGATVIGARPFLIAYNVNLNSRDKKHATEIALRIREGGRAKRDAAGEIVRRPDGTPEKEPGLFRSVKAVGWFIPEYQRAQVSINLTNYEVAPPHEVFDACCRIATELGLRVTGSELVGLIPREALLRAGRHYLVRQGKTEGAPEQEVMELAIQSLGLRDLGPFDAAQKVIEYRVGAGDGPLVRRSVRGFVDELSTDSPAPGGGSAAALMGALASALAAMVANLTHGKKGFDAIAQTTRRVAREGQELKEAFLADIDRDTEAFNGVMAAMRLPAGGADAASKGADAAAKAAAVAAAYRDATMVPLTVLERCEKALELAITMAEQGNPSSASDAGVAGLAAGAAAASAHLNVLINLPGLPEEERAALAARADAALGRVRELEARVASWMRERIRQ